MQNEVLIKAVAEAIPAYVMSMFQLPSSLIAEIHCSIGRFWRGIHPQAKV